MNEVKIGLASEPGQPLLKTLLRLPSLEHVALGLIEVMYG